MQVFFKKFFKFSFFGKSVGRKARFVPFGHNMRLGFACVFSLIKCSQRNINFSIDFIALLYYHFIINCKHKENME